MATLDLDKSALVVLVPEAEPLVGALRRQFDIAGIAGLGAHVTVLSPFAAPDVLPEHRDGLRALFESQPRFQFSLSGLCGFPSVIYLAPEPMAPFDALASAVAERFPAYPPYGGAFTNPVPHLTVAQSPPAADLAALAEHIHSQVADCLPLRCFAREVSLAVKRAGRWSIEDRFALG